MCTHFVYNIYDSIIDRKRYYHNLHLYVDKKTDLPKAFIFEGISRLSKDMFLIDYNQETYNNYSSGGDYNMEIRETIPPGFHRKVKNITITPLQINANAPNWTLKSTSGTSKSLLDFKGRAVLLDFSFIGCGGCMQAVPLMNKLHEKYKGKNIEIASIFFRDNFNMVAKFAIKNNIKYPIYVDENSLITQNYHVLTAPAFIFIDKNGNVYQTIIGYSDSFEQKASLIIDKLLEN